mgnify:CR=1 FL=1
MTPNDGAGEGKSAGAKEKSKWGAGLFFATLFVVLIFFWWLLIYSGGAAVSHG